MMRGKTWKRIIFAVMLGMAVSLLACGNRDKDKLTTLAVMNAANNGDLRVVRKGAEQGHPFAQAHLGMRYFFGDGLPQDEERGVEWLRKSADQGFAPAQYYLGLAYARGRGAPQDHRQAAGLYRKSAEQGFLPAQAALGEAYLGGQGVEKDARQGLEWIRKAAEKGERKAMYNLAMAYANGQGTRQDMVLAHKWFSLVASGEKDKGAALATGKLAEIELRMKPDQIRQAKALAEEWKARNGTVKKRTG